MRTSVPGVTRWGWFNKKMTSYQYRKSHCGDRTILRPSYLHNVISYTSKMTSLYWIRAQVISRYNIGYRWWMGHFRRRGDILLTGATSVLRECKCGFMFLIFSMTRVNNGYLTTYWMCWSCDFTITPYHEAIYSDDGVFDRNKHNYIWIACIQSTIKLKNCYIGPIKV